MLTCTRAPSPERDRRGALAAAVWVESVAVGSILGAAGAVATIAIGIAAAGTEPLGIVGALVVAYLAAIVGCGFGFIVGTLVGLELALLVTFGHRRLGARVVATLMPLAAMTITQPLAFLWARYYFTGSPLAILAIAVLDALLTLPGALWIAKRYRRRAAGGRVH